MASITAVRFGARPGAASPASPADSSSLPWSLPSSTWPSSTWKLDVPSAATRTKTCVPRIAPLAAGVLMSISPLFSRLKMKAAPPPTSSRGLPSSNRLEAISTVVNCSNRIV